MLGLTPVFSIDINNTIVENDSNILILAVLFNYNTVNTRISAGIMIFNIF